MHVQQWGVRWGVDPNSVVLCESEQVARAVVRCVNRLQLPGVNVRVVTRRCDVAPVDTWTGVADD